MLNYPERIELPVFVYGFLKPGELAYPLVEKLVDGEPVHGMVSGVILIRDGLPLLDIRENESAAGYLLFPGNHPDLYDAIRNFEPRSQYKWQEAITKSGVHANMLCGVKLNKGDPERLTSGNFRSRDDVVLTQGPIAVRKVLESANPEFEHEELFFFEVQMAYLLLWSIIERFMSLRYGPLLDPNDKLNKLAADPQWMQAISRITKVPQNTKVFDSRNLEHVKFDIENPKASLFYFYQFRSNIVHRGKGAITDGRRLKEAGMALLECLSSIWVANGLPWRELTDLRSRRLST